MSLHRGHLRGFSVVQNGQMLDLLDLRTFTGQCPYTLKHCEVKFRPHSRRSDSWLRPLQLCGVMLQLRCCGCVLSYLPLVQG